MSFFLYLLQETLEISFQLSIVSSVIERKGKFSVLSILFILSGILLSLSFYPQDAFITALIVRLSFLFYLLCLFLPVFRPPEVLIITIISSLFLLNTFQSSFLFMDRLKLSGNVVYLYLLVALIIAISFYFLLRRLRARFREFMNLEEMVLFIATFNILFGGSSEFLKAEVIPSIQKGLRFFLEDLMENTGEMLLIPSGENIYSVAGEIIKFFSSDRFAMALTAFLILLSPVVLFIRLLLSPEPVSDVSLKKAGFRKKIALYRTELLKRGSPIFFSFLSLLILLHTANLNLNPYYEPQAISLIPEEGILFIPLSDQTGDVSDMKLRKYSFMSGGSVYRIAVMMRPDGEVIACLDACEICPPRGYVQRGKYLICKYCNTPVPAESFGKEGGCNPVPLQFRIEGDKLLINTQDIIETSKRAGSKFRGRH